MSAYFSDPEKDKDLSCAQNASEPTESFIEVPEAFLSRAEGPCEDIRYIGVRAPSFAAVAAIYGRGEEPPEIMMGNLHAKANGAAIVDLLAADPKKAKALRFVISRGIDGAAKVAAMAQRASGYGVPVKVIRGPLVLDLAKGEIVSNVFATLRTRARYVPRHEMAQHYKKWFDRMLGLKTYRAPLPPLVGAFDMAAFGVPIDYKRVLPDGTVERPCDPSFRPRFSAPAK